MKAIAAALAFLVLAATTGADATPFNQALIFTYNPSASGIGLGGPPNCCDEINIANTPVPPSLAPATAATSYGRSGSWGNVSGSAQADLATGTLKLSASALGVGGNYPYMQANATFGDGFTTTNANGTPFTWGNNTATFHLSLDGTLASSDGFADSAGFIWLSILPKGTLDPSGSYLGTQSFLWVFGNPNLQIYYTDPSGNSTLLTTTQGYTYLPSSITADFQPGGNFDWVMLAGASGQEGNGNWFNINLSHTIHLSFIGPDGTITTSDSGVFDTVKTPEPLSIALFGAGLAALGGLRNRRKR